MIPLEFLVVQYTLSRFRLVHRARRQRQPRSGSRTCQRAFLRRTALIEVKGGVKARGIILSVLLLADIGRPVGRGDAGPRLIGGLKPARLDGSPWALVRAEGTTQT